jgi:type II secretion system protein G
MFFTNQSRKAFTLIELLIVVAIIAILAAIAVPNFLEAQTRAKVSRVRADVRSVATALETYRIDTNQYPPETEYKLPRYLGSRPLSTYYHARIPSWITTPISYINSIPEDIFIPNLYSGGSNRDRYVYFNYAGDLKAMGDSNSKGRVNQTGGYLFYSFGPDQHPNYSTTDFGPQKLGYMATFSRYDASNGTLSWGNIIRTARSPEGAIPYDSTVDGMNGPN